MKDQAISSNHILYILYSLFICCLIIGGVKASKRNNTIFNKKNHTIEQKDKEQILERNFI